MLFVFLFALVCELADITLAEPLVNISQGTLNGTILRSRDNKEFYAFYGIPYAQPPIGELRFAAPRKPPSWEGVRDATKKAEVCLQPNTFTSANVSFVGSEDCLYLSVYTPQLNPEKPLPVLVYIHGGAFHMGSGDGKGPHFFMDKPVIMVTMNYRHGVLGFLSSGDIVIPGNYALKDQVAALKWVQSNIANFGGDPNSVTILGQSSGSTCVHLHTLSPRSKGLFNRAIMQSGSGLAFWSHYNARHSKRTFSDLTQRVNCTQNTTIEVLSCLRNLSALELIKTENSFLSDGKRIVIKFRPAIESRKVKNAFMVASPRKLRYQNTTQPWIIGFNSAEGFFDTALILKKVFSKKKNIDRELTKTLPYILHYRYAVKKEEVSNVTATLKKFYFKDGVVHENDHQRICNLITDLVFAMPTLHAAETYPGPKYLYYYDYEVSPVRFQGLFNLTKKIEVVGSDHSDEMFRLFSSSFSSNKPSTSEEIQLSHKMIGYWSNFISKGDPNGDNLPQWNTLQPDTSEFLHITRVKISMEKDLLKERYEFWKKYIYKE